MYLEKLRLDGKTIVVSGAGGGGIGTATSLALAEAGANVVAVDIVEERARETAEQAAALGASCLPLAADLRERAGVDRVVQEALKRFGAVHGTANVTGGMPVSSQRAPLLDYDDDDYDAVLALNLRYVYLINRAVARSMVERGVRGSMVSVASVSGLTSAPNHGPYGAAKAGLMALTRTMAVEWGPHGIRVNAVAPGSVLTPRARAQSGGSQEESARLRVPIGRPCEPSEIAAGILFLLSDLASAVSGVTLVIDGGATANFAFGALAPGR